ncbi:MAG: efflux RND transporter periplasmic adaptor subunit [Patescibacteria group bacterium]
MFNKLLVFLKAYKYWSIGLVLILLGGGYYVYAHLNSTDGVTKYVLAEVSRGTLVKSISGTGQVSASDQVDLKTKASGDLIYLNIKAGQEVKAGDLLARLDTKDALKTVRDAEVSLETAQLSLAKLKQPADDLSILQSKNSLAQAEENKLEAADSIKKAYEDGFNDVSDSFLNLPDIMAGLHSVLFDDDMNTSQWNIDYYAGVTQQYDDKVIQYRNDVYDKYHAARKVYDRNFSDYKQASRFSEDIVIKSLIEQTYSTSQQLAEVVKSANNLIQFYQDKLTERGIKTQSQATTHLSSLSSYTSKLNSQINSLKSSLQAIDVSQQALVNAQRSIDEKTASLAKLQEPPDELDLRSQQLTVEQRLNSLRDAREKLADYYVYAPFDGLVAEVGVKLGDSLSSGANLATLITRQHIAEVSLNEVDATKIKIGQKVILTFDAVTDLSLTGQVAEIDTLGTVSQGVVNYTVKISFDTEDERVKPGMTISANIIVESKTDALLVPSSAVKSLGDGYYVDVPLSKQSNLSAAGQVLSPAPVRQVVTIGLTDDTNTEILSGLVEGDQVVVRIIDSTAAASSTSTGNSLFQTGSRGSTGGVRIQTFQPR